jgi:formate dehydrogenase major subunit
MQLEVSRRGFMRLGGAALATSTMSALGFGAGEALAASVRPFKLSRATETRSTCPYCSVSCGTLVYALGDSSKNARAEIMHVEGDPDHPVNRGTLCPRGAAILDFVRSAQRLKHPMHRAPGAKEFKRVSWDFALDRIAKLMKEDRDKNFVAKNNDGVTVNRWPTAAAFTTSTQSNEAGLISYKLLRSTGMVAIENQARI